MSFFGCGTKGEENFKKGPRQRANPIVIRATAKTCDNFRPMSELISPSDGCEKDADCTDGDNGRCREISLSGEPFRLCNYDNCFQDSDCPNNLLCNCGKDEDTGVRFDTDANVCIPGNCFSNQDCGSGQICRAMFICGERQIEGYYCTSNSDTCSNDSDCALGSYCKYLPESENWECDGFCEVGG